MLEVVHILRALTTVPGLRNICQNSERKIAFSIPIWDCELLGLFSLTIQMLRTPSTLGVDCYLTAVRLNTL